jgi:hypothetical protein
MNIKPLVRYHATSWSYKVKTTKRLIDKDNKSKTMSTNVEVLEQLQFLPSEIEVFYTESYYKMAGQI